MSFRACAIALAALCFWPAAAPAQVVQAPREAPEGMVSFSFDDAWQSQLRAVPILEAAGMRATFYITAEAVRERWDEFMTPEEVQSLSARGHDIGSHTVTHPHLPRTADAGVEREFRESKSYLEQLTKQPVVSIAYPYGEMDGRMKPMLEKAGYLAARGIEPREFDETSTDRYDLPAFEPKPGMPWSEITAAIERAKAKRQWLILIFHKIENQPGKYSMRPSRFRKLVNEIKSTGMRVVTVREGLEIVSARAEAKTQTEANK